jgi:hypothetical protein
VTWVLGLTIGCVALITVLTGWRLAYGWPSHAIARLAGALAIVLTLIAGAAWLAAGPLQPGWARRSGTPPSLITGGTRAAATSPVTRRALTTARTSTAARPASTTARPASTTARPEQAR